MPCMPMNLSDTRSAQIPGRSDSRTSGDLPDWQFNGEPEAFIAFALDSTLGIVGANAGSLFLWDEEKKALVLRSARGPYQDQMRDTHVRLREGISGWVGENGHSVLVKDIQADDRFHHFKREGHYRTYSFISLPLISSNKLLGVVNVTEKPGLEPFTEEEFERARVFVQHMAIAYDTMRIARKLRTENDRAVDRIVSLEKQLKAQEQLVGIGKLAANLAHELNNPLDSIRRYVNLSLDQVMEDSLARSYMLKAKEGIRRAIHVIRGLLQYSRESSRMEKREGELHAILRRSLGSVKHDYSFEGINLILNLHKGRLRVADYGLGVVFTNLLKNAYQAMEGRGCITISTSVVEDRAVIYFCDSGKGMPEEAMRRLFEPFFSTKKGEGTGIGLCVSKEIVEKCDGTIECESSGPDGTRFLLKIPCRK